MSGANDPVRILHIDEDADVGDLTATYLERENEDFAVETATSASTGLAIIRDRPPDCVISDYDMSDMNGVELLEAVREEHSELPFILFTGKGSEEVASKAISAGATDYLQKQSGAEQYELLSNRIKKAVSKAQSEQTERYLRELSETTEHILYVFAPDWSELLFINSAYEEIWGRPVESLRDDPLDFLNGVLPEDRDRVREAMQRMSDGETVDLECQINAEEDYDRWARIRGEPIRDDEGNVIRLAGFVTEITDKKRQYQDIQRYQQLFDSLTDPVVVYDTDGRYELANQPTAELRGTSVDKLIGKESPHLQRIRDQRDDDPVEELMAGTRDEFNGEYAAEFAATNERVFEYRLTPFYIDDEPEGIVGISRDITERKERERELERYKRLVENLPVGVFRTTRDGDIISMNERLKAIYDADSRTELRQVGVQGLYLNDSDRDRLLDQLRQTGQVENELFKVETLDGNRRIVRTTITLVEENGNEYLDGIVRDITDQVEQEGKLEQAKTWFENAQDALFLIDVSGEFTVERVNPAYEESTGFSEEDIVGRTPGEILGEDAGADIEEKYQQCVDQQTALTYEEELPIGSDRTYWETRIAPVVIDGQVEKIAGSTRDITARKQRRQQLAILDRVLRHNLRNDMNVIRGRADQIRSETSGEVAASAGEIIDVGDQLLGLTDKIRQITDLLREEPTHENIEVCDRLHRIAENCRTEYPEASIELNCPDEVTVRATIRLEQALKELVTNAIIHNDSSSPAVTLSVTETDAGARINVADTGPRIPEMDRAILLSDEERTPLYHGSGLGLWFVKLVISRSGGDITVAENSPAGNIVSIDLQE